jgi:hypothetical protein
MDEKKIDTCSLMRNLSKHNAGPTLSRLMTGVYLILTPEIMKTQYLGITSMLEFLIGTMDLIFY